MNATQYLFEIHLRNETYDILFSDECKKNKIEYIEKFAKLHKNIFRDMYLLENKKYTRKKHKRGKRTR